MEEVVALVMVPVLTAAIQFVVMRVLDWLVPSEGATLPA